jgi:ketosteroid isomerase-like protein
MTDRVTAIDPAETFQQFVTAINGHDVRALTALMTTDHLFVDSVGNRVPTANTAPPAAITCSVCIQ